MELRFRLEDGKSKTIEEVARDFGVPRERIRLVAANDWMAVVRRRRRLRDFLES
ncbi:MAG: hypothetical protein CL795_04310 [Chloroflexi bacterium]|nr:hypothetical protein [Chloroflexota bacterium]